jgi:hypothetical protein
VANLTRGIEICFAQAATDFNYRLTKTSGGYNLSARWADAVILRDATLTQVGDFLVEVDQIEQRYGKPTYAGVTNG